jgi:hypothetical protein
MAATPLESSDGAWFDADAARRALHAAKVPDDSECPFALV